MEEEWRKARRGESLSCVLVSVWREESRKHKRMRKV
jgi:hypothetical protein